ncbi:MAG: NAD(P)H-binding protein [Proteobacteria bacterium]|nr:NAD(P)H-binding protein [Pseudomonadota bacterium]
MRLPERRALFPVKPANGLAVKRHGDALGIPCSPTTLRDAHNDNGKPIGAPNPQTHVNDTRPRIFIAGASGVIGRVLCRLLVADGHAVVGTTRSPEKLAMLRGIGVEPMLVDVFDAASLREVVCRARPEVVVHQLTDLPDALDPAKMAAARVRNARIREIGTRNLIAAAVAAGARRLVAQSVAFAYAPGSLPHDETAPLNVDDADAGITARGVASLEGQVLAAPAAGIVLRYGKFYGAGTGFDAPPHGGPVHVEAAADAARRACTRGAAGIYNVAEDEGVVSSKKAIAELGWDANFRISAEHGQ